MEGAILDDEYTTSLYYELRLTISEVDSLPVGSERLASLQYQLDVTRFAIQRVVTLIVVIFGVVGNIFNIAVLTRRWMKSSTNHYLTALAVYDSLYLLLALTMSFSHYEAVRGATWYNRYRLPFGRPLTDVCSNTGVWLTLTFTVERYIGVCLPMKGKVWCTPRRAKYIILVVCLGAFVVTTPEFFEFEMAEMTDRLNRTVVVPAKTALGEQTSYRLGYYYVNQILFTFLPLLLLLIFNSLLIRAVMYAARQRKTMTKTSDFVTSSMTSTNTSKMERHNRDQQRITVMLITVVVVFLVCQLPQAVHKLYNEYLDDTNSMTPWHRTTLMITANYFNLLVMINCSINFVLYSSFSTKFRMTFRRLFCRPRTPEVVLTEMTTGNQTQIDEYSSVGNARGSGGSIASFSVTNPQLCRTRSPVRSPVRSPLRSPVRSPARSPSQSPVGRSDGGGYTYDRLLRDRLGPSTIEMKTFT